MRRLAPNSLAAASLGACLSACAPTQPIVQVPAVEVQQVRLTGLSLPGGLMPGGPLEAPTAHVTLDLRVTNPNPFALTLAHVGADLVIDGANVGHVDLPAVVLPARGTAAQVAHAAVPVTLDTAAGFVKVARGQLVTYRLDGTLTVNLGPLGAQRFGPFTLSQGQWKQPPLLKF